MKDVALLLDHLNQLLGLLCAKEVRVLANQYKLVPLAPFPLSQNNIDVERISQEVHVPSTSSNFKDP